MGSARIFDEPWPANLDPATVPFKGRTVTVLCRQGFYDDWSLFNDLVTADVVSWWNAGPVTVDDLRATGNRAIRRHHGESDLLRCLDADLAAVASEPWAPHVWYHDPRFTEFIPKGDATVYEIATSRSTVDRRYLWNHLDELRVTIDAQAALDLRDAVRQYVEAISEQSGNRLAALLARTGLHGRDSITLTDAGCRLGVSYQRIHQLERQLRRNRGRAQPPAGIWMPQIAEAERDGWSNEFTPLGINAIRSFFG